MGSSTAATAHTSPVATTSPLSAIATITLSMMSSGSSSSTAEEAAGREAPLRDRPRLGHRRVLLPLLHLLHAALAGTRRPWRPQPLQVCQPARILHALHDHLLRRLPLPAAGRRAHLRGGHGVCAVVHQSLQQAAGSL
uniref:Uncharacterized protein n=1 Tax=Aegilops tauschii TaxID=37682 RepID=M8BR93_AEGTA